MTGLAVSENRYALTDVQIAFLRPPITRTAFSFRRTCRPYSRGNCLALGPSWDIAGQELDRRLQPRHDLIQLY